MMINNLDKELKKINDLEVKYNISLKKYTSFKIGGPVNLFLVPITIRALQQTLPILNNHNIEFFILGRGSNLIVSDQGYHGAVIYTGRLNNISIENTTITAETGIALSSLASKAQEAGLSGLEFASGIPGSLGGALYMNAGAYGGEMSNVVSSASVLDYKGNPETISKKDLQLSYRHSILQEKKLILTAVTLKLRPGNKAEIRQVMKELNQKRKDKQPLEWPSAGSIFKRPEGYYSGPLVEKAGMKGARIGDAQVSEKHAGFIINLGNATASDVKKLITKVQDKVYQTSGVKLEVEPHFIGDF
nr:UDP-N-acetylmuramate dehydrogenase [Halocella sp. SP3-1]